MNKIFFIILLVFHSAFAAEQKLLTNEQSAQFISYWKSDVVTSEQDGRIKLAEKVYARLLRGWDSSRLEPGLFVVDSEEGPWAASLVDGNILLSLKALETINNFGTQRAEHLLAFVLAHELAHQRADDLWQHRFFRLYQNRQHGSAEVNMDDLQIDKRALQELEQKEARADHDGLILMSSVGFNPYQVLGKKDFFTEWVESIWQTPCQIQQDVVLSDACFQAKSRALRAHTQLETVASQSSLYDLGVQSLVANKFTKARYYFTQYARDFPSRAVMSALGLSHLAEAIQLLKELIQQGLIKSPDFFYPLMLDASAGIENLDSPVDKRAIVGSYLKKQQQKIDTLVKQAITYFEKAIRLQPDFRNSYVYLANAYLLAGNTFMVRGVLQGQYIPRLGQDKISAMMLAMTSSLEGKLQQGIKNLQQLVASEDMSQSGNEYQSGIPVDLLHYSLNFNLSALLIFSGQAEAANDLWKQFAKSAKSAGNAYLFRLALEQLLAGKNSKTTVLKDSPTINGLRLGNKKTRDDSGHSIHELWIEGDQYHVYDYINGAQFITATNGSIISARQQNGDASLEGMIKLGDEADRSLKSLGLPDRRIHLVAGEYLAYDQYGLALHIDDDQIKGWFLY